MEVQSSEFDEGIGVRTLTGSKDGPDIWLVHSSACMLSVFIRSSSNVEIHICVHWSCSQKVNWTLTDHH